MIELERLQSLIGQYGSANVAFAYALSEGKIDEKDATNAVLDLHLQISKAIDGVYAENARLRELCHKSLHTLLRAGDASNWPDDVEGAIADLRKALGR